jgi:hypothetical protein
VACSTGLNPAKPFGVCAFDSHRIRQSLDGKPTGALDLPRKQWVSIRACVSTTLPSANRESKAARVLHTAGNRWVPSGHGLRMVCSPPIRGDPRSEVPVSKAGKLGATPSRPARSFRCGLLASQLRSERSPRRSDSCRLIQYTSRGLPASPLGFEPKARRFDSCLVFHRPRSPRLVPEDHRIDEHVFIRNLVGLPHHPPG